jgi:hypothetical protein
MKDTDVATILQGNVNIKESNIPKFKQTFKIDTDVATILQGKLVLRL